MQHKNFISKYVMKRRMEELLKEVKMKVGERQGTGNDYERLSGLFSRHHVNLAPSSLKRLWRYLTGAEKPSTEMLDRLALFAGFQDWKSLKETFMDEEE